MSKKMPRTAAFVAALVAVSGGMVAAAQGTPGGGTSTSSSSSRCWWWWCPAKQTPKNLWFQSFSAAGVTSQYHLVVQGSNGQSVDWKKPVGLVVRLHGDGAKEFDYGEHATTTRSYADKAISRNMIVLIPRTPDAASRTWWQKNMRATNRAWVTALVEKLLADSTYNLNPGDMTWFGYSGGAEFISYELLPHATEYVTSGAVLTGGGGAPTWLKHSYADDASERQLKRVPVAWVVGENDSGLAKDTPSSIRPNRFDAVRAARKGFDFYCDGEQKKTGKHTRSCTSGAEGYNAASLEIVPGKNHYNIDHGQILDKFLAARSPGKRR